MLGELACNRSDIVRGRGKGFYFADVDGDDTLNEIVKVWPFLSELRLKGCFGVITQDITSMSANSASQTCERVNEIDFHVRTPEQVFNCALGTDVCECDRPIVKDQECGFRRHRRRTVWSHGRDAANRVRRDQLDDLCGQYDGAPFCYCSFGTLKSHHRDGYARVDRRESQLS